jgi:hypothetical protein
MMDNPFVGKTYSLYSAGSNSDAFYEQLRIVADQCLMHADSIEECLVAVRNLGKKKRRLKSIARASSNSSFESFVVHAAQTEFSPFTTSAAEHLRELPLTKRWDRTLATSEEQYHLYMLEIELQNRFSVKSFGDCDTKLAFLPHCLRDLTAECQSAKRGEDYVCKGCSKGCDINAVSKLLRRHGVHPYIWMTANLQSLFRKLKKEGKQLGVLGIACIPELVSGMRMCADAEVPVVGIPLDANRCTRWWGEFYHNTVNLRQLERLLGREILKGASATSTIT